MPEHETRLSPSWCRDSPGLRRRNARAACATHLHSPGAALRQWHGPRARGEAMKHEHVKERVQDAVAELKTLRDEIRLELRLASMDVRDEWAEIEKRLPDGGAATRLKEVTKEALEALTQEVRTFRQRVRARRQPGEVGALMSRN